MKTSNELGLNYLNRALPKDEVNEDESLYTEGDCVLYQFYCGNWSQTVRRCYDNGVYWQELETFISEKAEELGMERYQDDFFGWFDSKFFAEFGANIERLRNLITTGAITS